MEHARKSAAAPEPAPLIPEELEEISAAAGLIGQDAAVAAVSRSWMASAWCWSRATLNKGSCLPTLLCLKWRSISPGQPSLVQKLGLSRIG